MIWSVQEIGKKLRMAYGEKVSPRVLHIFAKKLGYKIKSVGMKRGYDQSFYTVLSRHLKELFDYNKEFARKEMEKAQSRAEMPYYVYNGEADRVDYDFEVSESLIRRAVMESVNGFVFGVASKVKGGGL